MLTVGVDMPRVHWDDNSNEIHLISDEGYGTGSQDSFGTPRLVNIQLTGACHMVARPRLVNIQLTGACHMVARP